MTVRYVLTDYVDQALAQATDDKLDDGTFAGRVPDCVGAVAFGATLRACADELRSVLADWTSFGFKLGHPLSVIAGIAPNQTR